MIDDCRLLKLLNEADQVFESLDARKLADSGPCDTWKNSLRPIVEELIPILNAIGAVFPKARVAANALKQLKALLDALCPAHATNATCQADPLNTKLELAMHATADPTGLADSPCATWQKLRPVVEEVVAVLTALAVEFPVFARIASTMARIASFVDMLCGTGSVAPIMGQTGAAGGIAICVWEDDPYATASAGNPPVPASPMIAAPTNNTSSLKMKIALSGAEPPPQIYAVTTPEFRYWNAKDALNRGLRFWFPLLPSGTSWTQTANPMPVYLDRGVDFNAYYQRGTGLAFFHGLVTHVNPPVVVYSADSPSVSCHELGHAILDAVKPELFHVMSAETGAFHESFGDMSAMLIELQLDSYRKAVIAQTGGKLNNNSRLSQLARQLGWAIRQQFGATSVDVDSLRNACNKFVYRNPSTLPSTGPATTLTSEPHSFSRVFTGAFLDILAGMFSIAGTADSSTLEAVSVDMGKLLIGGIRVASVGTGYYSHVAAGMIQVDHTLFNGRYRNALVNSFVRRGILATGATVGLVNNLTYGSQDMFGVSSRNQGELQFVNDNRGYKESTNTPEMPLLPVHTRFGATVYAHLPNEGNRFAVAASSISGGWEPGLSPEQEAEGFLEDLFQRGHIDFKDPQELAAFGGLSPDSSKTHVVEYVDGKLTVKRRHFLCGCCAR